MMNDADARASCFQLLALGFAHPEGSRFSHFASGEFGRVLATQALAATGDHLPCALATDSPGEFEAEYIRLFQVGRRGRPIVSLNAADYDELLQGGDRPQCLLRYSQWYRHFGLKTAGDDNLLPDHLVCQLEFLAWLAQLEYRAETDSELERGYRRAQVDFIDRELLPLVPALLAELRQAGRETATGQFFVWLAEVLEVLVVESLALLQEQVPAAQPAPVIEAVNLWE